MRDRARPQLQDGSPVVVIRAATSSDIGPLSNLVAEHVQRGQLLPRSVSDIRASLMTWAVAKVDGELVGCASLRPMSPARIEVRSLAVRTAYRGQGIGAALVRVLLEQAWHAEATTVYALTRAVPFFERLGFQVTDPANLPEKLARDCVCCSLRHTCGKQPHTYGQRLCSGATDESASEQYGRFTAALPPILAAAITSAGPANPQDVQTKDA